MADVVPIDFIEAGFRRDGMFLLVAPNGKLWLYGYGKNRATIHKLLEALKPRRLDMINFLTARARAKG